jgi:hypothetical protein
VLFLDTPSAQISIKEGDVVTFSYEKHPKQTTPINPTIFRIRKDVTWEEVVESWKANPDKEFAGTSTYCNQIYVHFKKKRKKPVQNAP